MCWRRSPAASAAISSASAISCRAATTAPRRCSPPSSRWIRSTSISTWTRRPTCRNSKLWFEGKRPSSRDTANPVQVTLTGETKPSHEGQMDFLDNRLDVSTGTLRSRAVIPNQDLSILPGQFGRVRLIGSSPYEALLLPDTAIATDQSRKIVFVVKDDDTVEARAVVLGPLDDGLRVIREGPEGGRPRHRRRPPAGPRRRQGRTRKRPRSAAASHESRTSFHQSAHPGDGAVDRASDRGRARLPDAAGRRISRSGAADRGRHRAISGRVCADHLRHRRRSDRAADQRRRGHAVHVQPGHLERPAHHHHHLQARHRSRQGAGAGAEPRRDRATAIAGGGAAQRRRHQEELARHPDGRVHAVAGRHASTSSTSPTMRCCRSATSCCGSTASATSRFSARAIIRCGCGSIPTRSPISA